MSMENQSWKKETWRLHVTGHVSWRSYSKRSPDGRGLTSTAEQTVPYLGEPLMAMSLTLVSTARC